MKTIHPNHTRLLMENVITPLLTVASCIHVYLHTYEIQSFTNPRNGESGIKLNVRESIELLMAQLRIMSKERVAVRIIEVSEPHEADLKFRPLPHYLAIHVVPPGQMTVYQCSIFLDSYTVLTG